jgi:hypothetical protein
MVDRAPGQPKADDKDKDAARFLLKGKVRGKRKKKPWYEQVWVRAAGLLVLLGGVIFTLVLALRPPPRPSDDLYNKAAQLMGTNKVEDAEAALDGPIAQYQRNYGKREDPHRQQMQELADEAERRIGEDLLRRYRKFNLAGKKNRMDVQNDDEKRAFQAIEREDDGDLEEAGMKWKELVQDAGLRRWKLVAHKHLEDLKEQEALEKSFRAVFARMVEDGKEPPPQEDKNRSEAFLALRQEHFGDVRRAAVSYKNLGERASKYPDLNLWYLLAARKVRDMNRKAETGKERKALIEERLAQAAEDKNAPDRRRLKAWAVCMDVLALYGGEDESDDVKKLVEQARSLLREMAPGLSRKPPAEAAGATGPGASAAPRGRSASER